jgi:hypothetical protein
MAWSIVSQDPESGLYMWSDGSSTKWGGLDGTYWDESGNRQNIRALEPTPAGWSVTNSVDNGEAGYTAPTFTNGNLSLSFNPATGPASRIEALEALYSPYVSGNTAKMNEIIAASPDAYAGFGITPQNAADMVNSTFYDRINNIDNDPLSFLNNLAFLPHMAGLANVFTGGGVDSFLSKYLGEPASVSVQSGGMPTQVGGWQWSGDPRFAGTTVDGVLQPSGQNWWNTDWGTEGLVDLGGASGGAMPAPGMPPAIPETTQQLTEWGLKEVSPGVWSQPAMPDIQMTAGDWLKYGLGTLGSSLGGQIASGLGSSLTQQTGDSQSLMGLLGKLSPSLLGMYASNQQANKLSELAQKYQDFGAPYRQKLAEISADPNAFYNSEGAQKATDTVLRKLSIGGNPAGSANKQALTIDSLYDQYGKERDRLAGFGGLTNYNQAAPQLETQAIGANANMWNAAGAGLNDIFNPKPSLSELFKQMKTAGAF